MISTIVLSKDRPAQLDLLLRSIKRNGGEAIGGRFSSVTVLARFSEGYKEVRDEHDLVAFAFGDAAQFEDDVRWALDQAGEFVCFMCDDGILYRPLETTLPQTALRINPQTLCFSLRLGRDTTTCYPSGVEQGLPPEFGEPFCQVWDWTRHPTEPGLSDFGYPGSIDAHVFRTADVQQMLAGRCFPNPTALECALVDGCFELADERPLMACYPHSVYVGNPINRVSEQSNVRYGERFPLSADECRERFLSGLRIDLDALDFSAVNGAHTEIELQWTKARSLA